MQNSDKKSFSEIFGDIPAPLKIVVVAGALFIVYVLCYLTYLLAIYEPPKKEARAVSISNTRMSAGILDPSLATDGSRKVMAYTIVEPMTDGSFGTEVLLSAGVKNCLSWNVLGGKIELRPDTLIGPDLTTPVASGFWRAETPSIVYDPEDTGREWKLFAYRYFWSGSASLARLYGVIVMRYADRTLNGDWSREEWIMSASDSTPPQPYANVVGTKLNALHADLRDVYFYARPSVVNVGNVLVMSLSAFVQGKESPDRIVLLASADHARSWRYLGTALRDSDVGLIGDFSRLDGGSLFMKDQVMYLAVTLSAKDSGGAGAHILEFDDASTARLRRTVKGAPAVVNHIRTIRTPPSRIGGGALAYSDACPGKTFISESLTGQRHDIFAHPVAPVE